MGRARGPDPKPCLSCGRRITWRKKWERDWDEVRYCSAACRRRGVTDTDRALEQHLLRSLGPGTTERVDVAAAASTFVAPSPDDGYADLDEAARRAARRLVASGELVMLQKGVVVDPSTASGPVEVRRVPRPST